MGFNPFQTIKINNMAVAKTIKNNVEMSWEKLKISDFTSVITGGTPSTTKTEYWENGHIPWLNSGALNQEIITESENFITQAGLENSSTRMMPKDTILIALTGTTTGVVGYLSFEACANQSVTGILPSNKHHPKFLYYYLKSIREQILEASYGGAQKHISQAFVKELLIPLPPLATQKRIADILDTADALRRKDQELLTKYDQLAQAIFIDMFGDPVKNEKGWEVKKLEEVSHKITDGTHLSPKFTNQGVPFLLVSNIVNNEINYKTEKYISKEEFEILNKRTPIEVGNILMTSVGSYGNPAIIEEKIDFAFQRHIAFIKPIHEVVDYKFLFSLLKTEQIKNQIDKKVNGVAQKTLNLKDLKELNIIMPPLRLQIQFSEIFNKLYKQKSIQQNSHSTSLFSSLIQQAFNGTLVS
ncbi:MAG: hypothetical protein RI952_1639 [Bacteroidota bacterium]|jgi:type I restriction enzyme S subunit